MSGETQDAGSERQLLIDLGYLKDDEASGEDHEH